MYNKLKSPKTINHEQMLEKETQNEEINTIINRIEIPKEKPKPLDNLSSKYEL